MWWDADIDAVMARTHLRPIPQGVVPKPEAANFGLVLSALAVALLALASNYLAAGLLAFTIFFYVVVYSMWLKRVTPQNIVIGGAAGALPPVVGWAAVSGDAPLAAWTLFLIVFLWTPPHFWALSLYRESDYARADIPMMPVVKGERSTRRQIFAYAILLALAALGPFTVGIAGQAYLAAASAGSAAFLFLSFRLLTAESGSKAEAKTLFAYSLLYLFALFAVLLAEDLWAMYV
jgi:protoheme IX farnesyltransferase